MPHNLYILSGQPQGKKKTLNETQALQPYITAATGIDISPQMLETYTHRMSEAAIPAKGLIADFASGETTDTEAEAEIGRDFDIAVVGLGFHHFEDPEGCLRRLGGRMGKGGVVVVVDWEVDGHHHHHEGGKQGHGHGQQAHQHKEMETETPEWKQIKHTIKHNGFDEEGLKLMFEAAGLRGFGFLRLEEMFVLEMNGKRVEKKGFVARGYVA